MSENSHSDHAGEQPELAQQGDATEDILTIILTEPQQQASSNDENIDFWLRDRMAAGRMREPDDSDSENEAASSSQRPRNGPAAGSLDQGGGRVRPNYADHAFSGLAALAVLRDNQRRGALATTLDRESLTPNTPNSQFDNTDAQSDVPTPGDLNLVEDVSEYSEDQMCIICMEKLGSSNRSGTTSVQGQDSTSGQELDSAAVQEPNPVSVQEPDSTSTQEPVSTSAKEPTSTSEELASASRHIVSRLITCGHLFHRECIELWLMGKKTCPLCRTRVEQDE